MAFLKSLFVPPHLADFIPGLLFKMSISNPESSAKQIKLDFLEKYFDFIKEFCSKVLPISRGLFKLNFAVENILISLGNKFLISLNFPLLFVPIKSLLIFFFDI